MRGIAVVEALIAALVGLMSFYVFMQVFESTYRHSQETRNRTVATILAQSLLEEVEAHPWGRPAPQSWDKSVEELPTAIWVAGRPVEMRFRKSFDCANGSFIGKPGVNEVKDLVTISITWSEVNVGSPNQQNNELKVQVPVWE